MNINDGKTIFECMVDAQMAKYPRQEAAVSVVRRILNDKYTLLVKDGHSEDGDKLYMDVQLELYRSARDIRVSVLFGHSLDEIITQHGGQDADNIKFIKQRYKEIKEEGK